MPRDRSGLDLFSDLRDENQLSDARRKAEKDLAYLGSDEIRRLRERAKSDLFFLAYGILGYDLLSESLHGHLCRWLEATRDLQYRCELLPRGHYKSTLITIAESIQMALPNDAGISQWPYCLGPNVKLLLAHETAESAGRFLFEIAGAFMRKPLMLALFPECIPEPRRHRINKRELELPRSSDIDPKEPTFDTIGCGGAAQGRHYNWIKLDDIIGEEARESPTVMKRSIDWFDNVTSLLTRLKFDGFDLTGTRWAAKDIYEHAIEKYKINMDRSVNTTTMRMPAEPGPMAVYLRPVIEHGEIIFPEEFEEEKLNILRSNAKVWAAQYANDPKESGLTTFNPAWLKYYNIIPNTSKFTVFDGDGGSRVIDAWNLDRVMMVDPSVGEDMISDETGIVVTGTDKDMNIYLLEAFKERLKPPELIERIIDLYFKFYPRSISFEEVVFSSAYKYWLQQKSAERGVRLPIVPFKPGSKRSKESRIDGLGNFFAAGQFYILEGMHQFRDEYENYPMLSGSDHILDALAQGPSIWGPGMETSKIHSYRKIEQRLLAQRDSVTGY